MTLLAFLPTAVAEVQKRLDAVGLDQWRLPTPCDQWDVAALVNHCIAGSRMTNTLLRGGSKDDAMASLSQELATATAVADFAHEAGEEQALFDTADLATMVPHPAMEMPLAQLLNFRLTDYLAHGWDLARALGTDETLDSGLVLAAWDALQPMAPMIPHTGVFGTGPSGTVPADAPLQRRLLDLLGRRP